MKVSIITICFNSVETIEDTIGSVLSQDYKDIEYIVVDGGSTDETLEILSRYKNRISRIISEPDEGIYDAMNKGIRLATGEIIGFLNSGDIYMSESVAGQVVDSIQANDTDCCYGNLELVSKEDPEKTVRKWVSQPYQDSLFKKGWHPPHPTFFVKKSVYDKYGFFDLSYSIASDYELMLRFLQKYSISSCYIPTTLVRMRIGGKSNKNLCQIIRANIECYRAWKKNGLTISPFIMLRKPLSKVRQYFVKQ